MANWPAAGKPSPSWRGWGEGESLSFNQRHRMPGNLIVIPGHYAVPGQPGFWIPAYAGMTVGGGRE